MQSLPEDCALYCSFALSKLEEIWGQMLDGKIAVFELQKVSKNELHMENLCCAVGIDIDIKDSRRKEEWSMETVHNTIQQRVKELSAIHVYREKLKYLCTLVQEVPTGTCPWVLLHLCTMCKCTVYHHMVSMIMMLNKDWHKEWENNALLNNKYLLMLIKNAFQK